MKFYRPYELQNPGCNRPHTNKLYLFGQTHVMIRSLITLLKMRGSCNNSHPACGKQMLNIYSFHLFDSFKAWNNMCL